MMFAKRVNNKLLQHRLDSWFYNPKALDVDNTLNQLGNCYALKELVDDKRKITNGVRGPDWKESTYKLIRLQDCKNWIVDSDNAASISVDQYIENKRCALKEHDIVVAIGGYVGNASVVNEPATAVIGQHSAMLSYKEGGLVDSRYLVAFLNSSHAEIIFDRFVSGTVQAGVNLEDLRDLPAPVFDFSAQRYIGDKVRQAEKLRAWAKKVEVDVNSFHQQFIPGQSKLDFSRKTRFVSRERMTDRFDAHFYPGVVEDYLASKTSTFQLLGKVTATVFNGQTQDETEGSSAVDQITVANLSRDYVKGKPRRVSKPGSNDKFTKRHDLLICNAAHNKSYIGRDVTYYHSENPVLPSTEVMVIRVDRNELPASFVRTYLLTKLGFVQVQSTIRGITAHSYPVDMKKLDIPVPDVPAPLRDEWFACDVQMAQAGYACEVASKLTSAAKFIVEALIEGRITEQQLINAQQAVVADDTSLDQDILARLTTKGFDVDGDPLFADLDQLYDLLAQSHQMDE